MLYHAQHVSPLSATLNQHVISQQMFSSQEFAEAANGRISGTENEYWLLAPTFRHSSNVLSSLDRPKPMNMSSSAWIVDNVLSSSFQQGTSPFRSPQTSSHQKHSDPSGHEDEAVILVRILDKSRYLRISKSAVLGDLCSLIATYYDIPLSQQYLTHDGRCLDLHVSVQEFHLNSNPILVHLRLRGGDMAPFFESLRKKFGSVCQFLRDYKYHIVGGIVGGVLLYFAYQRYYVVPPPITVSPDRAAADAFYSYRRAKILIVSKICDIKKVLKSVTVSGDDKLVRSKKTALYALSEACESETILPTDELERIFKSISAIVKQGRTEIPDGAVANIVKGVNDTLSNLTNREVIKIEATDKVWKQLKDINARGASDLEMPKTLRK